MNGSQNPNPNDRPLWQIAMEQQVGLFLRYGVWFCAVLLTAGLAAGLSTRGTALSSLLIQIGTAALILLPICRVALTFILLLRHRDYTFVKITGLVLVILILGLAFGKEF